VTDQSSRLSLYRQWRPQTFSEIVGQEAIVQTLRNAVLAQEVAHAYLFSGERGIGKTSVARILARAVNCLNPSNGEPCNECANCSVISANRSLDIVEIDGASNRDVRYHRTSQSPQDDYFPVPSVRFSPYFCTTYRPALSQYRPVSSSRDLG